MLEDYLEMYMTYLDNINRSDNTKRQYKKEIKYFFEFLNEKEIKDLNKVKTIHIDLYQNTLNGKGNSSTTRAKKNSILKSFFKYMHSRDYIDKNPTEALDPIKIKDVDKKKRETLTVDEAMKLIKRTTKNSIPSLKMRNKLILLTFVLCGLRVSELCNLKVEDVDLKNKTIHVKGKGGKIREVPLFDEMISDFKEYMKNRPHNSEYVFTKKQNSDPLVPRTVHALIKDHVKKSNIDKNIGCHSLRRTSATIQLQSGTNIRYIQQNLGHNNIGTTMLYLQVDKEEIKEEIRSKNILNKKIKKERRKKEDK